MKAIIPKTEAQKAKEREDYIAKRNYDNAFQGQQRLILKGDQIITSIRTNPYLTLDDKRKAFEALQKKIENALQNLKK